MKVTPLYRDSFPGTATSLVNVHSYQHSISQIIARLLPPICTQRARRSAGRRPADGAGGDAEPRVEGRGLGVIALCVSSRAYFAGSHGTLNGFLGRLAFGCLHVRLHLSKQLLELLPDFRVALRQVNYSTSTAYYLLLQGVNKPLKNRNGACGAFPKSPDKRRLALVARKCADGSVSTYIVQFRRDFPHSSSRKTRSNA
jgi:hypothetical protein